MIEGLSPQVFAVLVGVATVFGITIFLPILKLVMDVAEYSYANARISSMDGALIKKKRYSELVDVGNLEEFVGMLDNTSYEEFLGKIGTSIDENSVEGAIEEEYANTKGRVVSMLPEDAKKAMGAYLKVEEVHLVKNILRRIASGYRNFEGLRPLGEISSTRLTSLVEADTVKEFIARLEGTEYYGCLNAAHGEYESSNNLIFLEGAIDKHVMDQIWKGVSYSQMPLLYKFVGREIDIQNIMVSLRAKADGIKGSDLEKYITKGGYEIEKKTMKEVIDAESVEDVVSLLEGTSYGKILSDTLPAYGENGLSIFEDGLRKYRYALSKGFAVQVLHIGPVLAYLTRKENEITNLKTIIKCKSINMGKDEIEGLMVV